MTSSKKDKSVKEAYQIADLLFIFHDQSGIKTSVSMGNRNARAKQFLGDYYYTANHVYKLLFAQKGFTL